MHRKLVVRFLSAWQVGSGLGDGYLADSRVNRDHDGLPWLPGRAIKGALREAAWRLGACREDLRAAENIFFGGRSLQGADEVSRAQGLMHVAPGYLCPSVRQAYRGLGAAEREDLVQDMLCHRVQTALDDGRRVVNGSLRTLECGMPGLEFESGIDLALTDSISEDWAASYLAALCAGVKSMGGNRSRGLGRCQFVLEGVGAGPVKMPAPWTAGMGGVA